MNDDPAVMIETNPFATRWVRPGAIAYRFPPSASIPGLLERLAANDRWGEIIGPHGSGKSTLIAALLPALEQLGRRVISFTLHEGERRLPIARAALEADLSTVVVVDGYEQLSRWQAWLLRRYLRGRRSGLIITAHEPMGLPPLWHTSPSLELARGLAAELMAAQRTVAPLTTVTSADVDALYAAHQGDLREMFFALYDLHEQRRRQQPAASDSNCLLIANHVSPHESL